MLVGFLSDECLEVVREKDTAWLMWKALEDTFAKRSVTSQTLLRKQLARLRMKEGFPTRNHFVAFDDLIRQLKSAGAKLEESDLVSQLFLTLPDSYDHLVTALENLEEKNLTLETVKQRLLAEESKRVDRQDCSSDDKGAAFVGGKKNEKKKFTREFNGKCHRCKKSGHMKKDCPWKKTEGNAHSAVGNRKAVAFMGRIDQPKALKKPGNISFCVDSGCSDHLVNKSSYLKSLKSLNEPFVVEVAKEGVSLIGKSVGELIGISNKNVEFRMKNVILIPELRENLLSVKKLSQAGIDVLFTGQGGVQRAEFRQHGEVIGVAYLKGNLYQLELEVGYKGQANISTVDANRLWHRRLGHASQQAMERIANHEMATGFTKKVDRIGFCDTCVMAKQSREPFDGVRERATRPLERIHFVGRSIHRLGTDQDFSFPSLVIGHILR